MTMHHPPRLPQPTSDRPVTGITAPLWRLLSSHSLGGVLITLATLGAISPVQAHSSHLNYSVEPGVKVVAISGGEPLDQAQVLVFHGEDRGQPWLVGTTNDRGEFFFLPEVGADGPWTVKIQKGGHGGQVEIALDGAPNTGINVADRDHDDDHDDSDHREDHDDDHGDSDHREDHDDDHDDSDHREDHDDDHDDSDHREDHGDDHDDHADGITAIAAEPSANPTPVITTAQVSPYSPGQLATMIGSTVWGFIGTALFFARRQP